MRRNKLIIIASLFVIVTLATILVTIHYRPKQTISLDARDIAVIDIKQVVFTTSVDSKLVWIPGEDNSVAAIREGYSNGDKVLDYNLGTREVKELYNLRDYGINKGASINFFWSADGKRIILGTGGIANLETKTKQPIQLPAEYNTFNIDAFSPDGKMLFIDASGNNVTGSFILDIENGQYHPFNVNLNAFSPPLLPAPWKLTFSPLAWSSDGNWLAIDTYDPDNPPKSFSDVVPSALYLLNINNEKTRLIDRNIEGRITAVTFSPDGGKLVWLVMHNDGSQSISIANIDGSGAHEIFITHDYKINPSLVWSPDGSRIVFTEFLAENQNYPFWILTLGNTNSVLPTP